LKLNGGKLPLGEEKNYFVLRTRPTHILRFSRICYFFIFSCMKVKTAEFVQNGPIFVCLTFFKQNLSIFFYNCQAFRIIKKNKRPTDWPNLKGPSACKTQYFSSPNVY